MQAVLLTLHFLLSHYFLFVFPVVGQQSVAWSKIKEQKEKRKARKIKGMKKAIKRKAEVADMTEGLEDLAEDIRLMKKLKKGKVSVDEGLCIFWFLVLILKFTHVACTGT